jgi:acyl carrier protein
LSETEAVIADLWREILGTPKVGPRDSFFELGGDSMIGVQLIARLREIFGVQLGLNALFEAPTPCGLAAAVEKAVLAEIESMEDSAPPA